MGGAWVGVGLCVWGMFMGYGWVYGVGLIVRVAEKSRFAGRQDPGLLCRAIRFLLGVSICVAMCDKFVPGMCTFAG